MKRLARSAALRAVSPHTTVAAERGVALTFDDGPDPVFTPQVLDVLAEHGAVATFFAVGKRAERHPELVRRIVDEGHALGSHSWSHREPGELSARELGRDYRAGRRAVEARGLARHAALPPAEGTLGRAHRARHARGRDADVALDGRLGGLAARHRR